MQKSQGVLDRQDVRLNQEENENDTEKFGAIFLLIISYEKSQSKINFFSNFLKIFEKSLSYREELRIQFRDRKKSSTYRDVRQFSSFRDFFSLKRACKLKEP